MRVRRRSGRWITTAVVETNQDGQGGLAARQDEAFPLVNTWRAKGAGGY
jgi:hypothetical protein